MHPAAGPIELHLRDLSQFFHSLDPAPFQDRDLDREAARFIREEMEDRDPKEKHAVVVHLPQHQLDQAPAVADAVHAFFARERQTATRELRQLMRFARFALLVGLFAVFIVVAIGQMLSSITRAGTLAAGLAESLTIFGWVFLWRPAELLLFDCWPIRQRILLFRRLETVPVRCVGYEA
jgi:hypothetical protein